MNKKNTIIVNLYAVIDSINVYTEVKNGKLECKSVPESGNQDLP